eukprot:1332244-Amorphochlora_amoeboformis.AAC.1
MNEHPNQINPPLKTPQTHLTAQNRQSDLKMSSDSSSNCGVGSGGSGRKGKRSGKGKGLLPCPKCNASDRSIRNGWSRMQTHRAR